MIGERSCVRLPPDPAREHITIQAWRGAHLMDALRLQCQFGYDGAGQYVGDGNVAQFSDERVE